MTAKRISLNALLLSLSLVMFIVESFIPPLFAFAPGVKLGLGNIFILVAVVLLGGADGLVLAILKNFMGCLFTGNLSACLYSLPASLLSCAVMIALIYPLAGKLSLPAVSAAASSVFNVVQIAVSAAILSSTAVFGYLPYVLPIGLLTGFFTGAAARFVIGFFPVKLLK